MGVPRNVFGAIERRNLDVLIGLALAEDLGDSGDLTSRATIPRQARGAAELVARAPGILAGLPVVERVATEFGLGEQWLPCLTDGDPVEPGSVIARLAGPIWSLLVFERTALNFLQRLSGIATLTARFVAAVAGTRARIYDTRKTTPGWRALEKYAVRCGGGCNHRYGLYDAVLIKDNHLAWLDSTRRADGPDPIAMAIAAARANTPRGTQIEVEIDTRAQLDCALASAPDIILVDNLGPEFLEQAVRLRDAAFPAVQLEASGGVNLETVAALARTGVDRVSIGALTHSAPSLDIAIDYDVDFSQHLEHRRAPE
jgi:nicotinate-nucleotide pyrophosphorylase (carboxylating)